MSPSVINNGRGVIKAYGKPAAVIQGGFILEISLVIRIGIGFRLRPRVGIWIGIRINISSLYGYGNGSADLRIIFTYHSNGRRSLFDPLHYTLIGNCSDTFVFTAPEQSLISRIIRKKHN